MLRAQPTIFVLLALISAPACATSDDQIWTTSSATVKLDDHWRLSEEIVGRFSENKSGLYEIESNTLLGYRLDKVVTIWAGYTLDPQYSAGDFTRMEHRAREQIVFDNFTTLGPGKLSARIRLEQRRRDGVGGTAWRVRPFVKYSLPMSGKVSLNLSSEPFVNFNTTSFQEKKGLDRFRNLVTLSVPFSPRLTGEVGYMNQYLLVGGGPDESDHIAYFSVSLSL